jgi:hypothetical protein
MGSRCALKKIRNRLCEIFGASVASIIGAADLEEARELVENAKKASIEALLYAQKISKDLGLNSKEAVVEGPLKKLDRIFEKAIGKHDGHLDEVPDVGRLRILIEKPEDIEALRRRFVARNGEILEEHPSNKITVTEFQDNFLHPSSTGRIAIHIALDVRIPGQIDPVPYEIQVIHKDMVATEIFTHDNYQRACEIERKAKAECRKLTADESQAIEHYRESNRQRYMADALRLGLYDLRHPRHKMGSPSDLLHLVA